MHMHNLNRRGRKVPRSYMSNVHTSKPEGRSVSPRLLATPLPFHLLPVPTCAHPLPATGEVWVPSCGKVAHIP